MAGEWADFTIGDIAEVVGGSTPSTADAANFDGDVPWLTPKDLSRPHDRYVSRGERNLSSKGLASCSARLLPPNSVLLSSRAPIGYLAIAANPIATNQGFRSLILKPGFDAEFIYYWLAAKVDELERQASGSTFKELSGGALKQIRIRLPVDHSEQRAIAHILGTLDEQIELNRRMNKTLEAMARAIFKSWFVDFDPVRAKAEGKKPYGMAAETAALFPDSFEDSELGEIPKGWRVGPILETARLLSGGTPKTDRVEYWGGSIPWASAKDVSQSEDSFLVETERNITDRGLEESATQLIPALCSVVVARGATTGRMVLLGHAMTMNQTCYALETTTDTPFALNCHLRQEIDNLVHAAHGSVFDTITTSTFATSKVVLPSRPVLAEFEQRVGPLFHRILTGTEASRTLAALRDKLLPKLISGELRVPVKRVSPEAAA